MIFYGGRSNHAEAGRIKWVGFIYQQQNSVNTLALLLMMYRMGFDQISAIASRKAKVAISNETSAWFISYRVFRYSAVVRGFV